MIWAFQIRRSTIISGGHPERYLPHVTDFTVHTATTCCPMNGIGWTFDNTTQCSKVVREKPLPLPPIALTKEKMSYPLAGATCPFHHTLSPPVPFTIPAKHFDFVNKNKGNNYFYSSETKENYVLMHREARSCCQPALKNINSMKPLSSQSPLQTSTLPPNCTAIPFRVPYHCNQVFTHCY